MTTKGSNNPFPSVLLNEVASDGSDTPTPAADYRRLFLGEDGDLHLIDSADVVTDVGGSGGLADPMTTRGDIIVRNASNTTARLAIGANLAVLRSDGTDPAWGIVPGTIIGYKSNTAGDVTTTSASFVDADATNLAVTFEAPASTNVLVRLTAMMSPSFGGSEAVGTLTSWGLRESTTNIAGAAGSSIAARVLVAGGTVTDIRYVSVAFTLTGISGGSHTYKWAYSTSSGTTKIYASANSPATMEVIALA